MNDGGFWDCAILLVQLSISFYALSQAMMVLTLFAREK
jgi:hypothetical protein